VTHSKATAWWHSFMWALLTTLAAFAAIIATGCGDDDAAVTVSAPETEREFEDPQLTAEELIEGEEWLRSRTAKAPPEDWRIDKESRYDLDPNDIEKGSLPALIGWALKPCLAFQDGQQEYCGRDHCEVFGLACDSNWHEQSSILEIRSEADFFDNWEGRCNQSNAWGPCMIPQLTASNRDMSWFFNAATCPSASVGRRIIRNGMVRAANWLSRYAFVNMYEAASVEQADIEIACDDTLDASTAASWRPWGPLTLLYALADTNTPLTISESCETPRLPGFGSGLAYKQSLDMMYSYKSSRILINYNGVFDKFYSCTTNEIEVTRGWGNVFMHEIGHKLGFAHDLYDDLSLGIMYAGGSQTCEELTLFSKGFSEHHIAAIFDIDNSTDSFGLDVYDEDLSCFSPVDQRTGQ
jgi:hypothetical protein